MQNLFENMKDAYGRKKWNDKALTASQRSHRRALLVDSRGVGKRGAKICSHIVSPRNIGTLYLHPVAVWGLPSSKQDQGK